MGTIAPQGPSELKGVLSIVGGHLIQLERQMVRNLVSIRLHAESGGHLNPWICYIPNLKLGVI